MCTFVTTFGDVRELNEEVEILFNTDEYKHGMNIRLIPSPTSKLKQSVVITNVTELHYMFNEEQFAIESDIQSAGGTFYITDYKMLITTKPDRKHSKDRYYFDM